MRHTVLLASPLTAHRSASSALAAADPSACDPNREQRAAITANTAIRSSAASRSIPSLRRRSVMSSRKRGNEEEALDESSSDFSSKRARNPEGVPINTSGVRGQPGSYQSQGNPPGLVLHVRSLPTFTSEEELIALLAPFAVQGSNTPAVVRAFITQHNHQVRRGDAISAQRI